MVVVHPEGQDFGSLCVHDLYLVHMCQYVGTFLFVGVTSIKYGRDKCSSYYLLVIELFQENVSVCLSNEFM